MITLIDSIYPTAKINCTNVDALTPNQPSPLTEDVKSEMTRSQSNYSLKNDNGDSHLAVNGNGSLIKNSFSSTNLAESASKMAREFKVIAHFSLTTTFTVFSYLVQRSILEKDSTKCSIEQHSRRRSGFSLRAHLRFCSSALALSAG